MKSGLARQLLLASASGLCYPLCFPPFDAGVAAWMLLVPLHLSLSGLSPKQGFRTGWFCGFLAFVTTMHWVVTAMNTYGNLPLLPSYGALFLLAAYLGLFFGLYGMALVWFRRILHRMWILGAACTWVTLELIRTYAFSGLPWALFGYSQYQWTTLIQFSDHTGVYGISFLLVLSNGVATLWVEWACQQFRAPSSSSAPVLPLLAAIGTLSVVLGYGYMQLPVSASQDSTSQSTGPKHVTIGIVQPNVDQSQKWDQRYRDEILRRFDRLTRKAAKQADLVIWPEAATPFIFMQEPTYQEQVVRLSEQVETPLLFGSPALKTYPDGRRFLLNSAYLLSPERRLLGRYDKQHLVPFGEYIPLKGSLLFFLDKLVEGIGDFEPGKGPTILELHGSRDEKPVRFGVVICYEVIFPDLVRRFSAKGLDFMATITNDAWFGDSAAPYQHFGMVVLRAVENRTAFARSANTGISGFIDPYGRILDTTPLFEESTLQASIPLLNARTFYSQYGDVFSFLCVIITGILLIYCHFNYRPHVIPGKGGLHV